MKTLFAALYLIVTSSIALAQVGPCDGVYGEGSCIDWRILVNQESVLNDEELRLGDQVLQRDEFLPSEWNVLAEEFILAKELSANPDILVSFQRWFEVSEGGRNYFYYSLSVKTEGGNWVRFSMKEVEQVLRKGQVIQHVRKKTTWCNPMRPHTRGIIIAVTQEKSGQVIFELEGSGYGSFIKYPSALLTAKLLAVDFYARRSEVPNLFLYVSHGSFSVEEIENDCSQGVWLFAETP